MKKDKYEQEQSEKGQFRKVKYWKRTSLNRKNLKNTNFEKGTSGKGEL